MNNLVLKDLPRLDELDSAASLSILGGSSCYSRQTPSCCPSEVQQPVFVRQGWGCQPVHYGCGPTLMPYGNMHSQQPQVIPL